MPNQRKAYARVERRIPEEGIYPNSTGFDKTPNPQREVGALGAGRGTDRADIGGGTEEI